MTRVTLAALALGAALVAGCGPAPPAPDRVAATVPTTGPAWEKSAAQYVRDAVAEARTASETGFVAVTDFGLGQGPVVTTSGTATAAGWSAVSITDVPPDLAKPDDPTWFSATIRSTGGEAWLQMRDWPAPMTGCWMHIDRGDVPVGITALTVGTTPAYVDLHHALTGKVYGDEFRSAIEGTAPLENVLRLLPNRSLALLSDDPPPAEDTPVPVIIGIDEGRVTSVKVSGTAIADALQGARVTLPSDLEIYLSAVRLRVTYPEVPPSSPPVSAPDPRAVLPDDHDGCERPDD